MSRALHLAYRAAQRLRMLWWRIARPRVHGVKLVVLGPGRTILLIRHSYVASHLWMLPGGGIARGEDAEAAGRRELMEETGIAVGALRLHGEFLDRSRGAHNHISILTGEGAGEPRCDGREIVEAAWHPLDALPDSIAAASLRRIVELRDGETPSGPDW
jgi:8-oxo-dGTP pyrophosphatase MutT (NUDIX family)